MAANGVAGLDLERIDTDISPANERQSIALPAYNPDAEPIVRIKPQQSYKVISYFI
jgi:hypothetical protein